MHFDCHESIAGAWLCQDGKVNIKSGHVYNNGYNKETKETINEMRGILSLHESNLVIPLLLYLLVTLVIWRLPNNCHNCFIVDKPMVAMVNKPTHLLEKLQPIPMPVSSNHVHQPPLNDLYPGYKHKFLFQSKTLCLPCIVKSIISKYSKCSKK